MPSPHPRPSRTVVVLLLLACFTVITLDVRGGDDSPVDPLRSAVGSVLGPVERGTSAAIRPVVAVPGFFRTTKGLRDDVARLEAENARLRGSLATTDVDRNRAAELDGLLAGARSTGYALVPARVVAMGPAQTFTRAVTIDAGTSSGVAPDMTVINNDGLVGRVIRADRSTATVLLIVDQESVVGGRLGSTMEIGYLRGRGQHGDDARLDLDLVDQSVTPARKDVLVTWGSRNGAPYVAGRPDRQGHQRAQQPFAAVRTGHDRAVRRLHLPRPRRRRGRPRHPRRPPGDHGRQAGGAAMTLVRAGILAALLTAAVCLQVAAFPHVSFDGVVPNLALLLVVAAALVRGPDFAATLGFFAGLAIDLAPPADHVAGRWALALVVVGYVAGRVRQDAGTSAGAAVITVAASSFIGTSLFALSGMLLHDPAVPAAEALAVIPVAVVYDVLLTPFVIPLAMRLLRRIEPHRVAY